MPRLEWDTSPVRTFHTVVRVAGTEREHEYVTWQQDLASALPQQVMAGDAFAPRTGQIVWTQPGISENYPTPWETDMTAPPPLYGWPIETDHGWVPAYGQSVTVDVIDGKGNEVRCFTGIIDSTVGDPDGGMVSKIIDRSDDFNRTVRVEALTEVGVPWGDNGEKRFTRPSNAWVIDDILRQCGYFATPPAPPGVILDAPLQGTVYLYAEPAAGHHNAQLMDSQSYTGEVEGPQFWGGGVETGLALRDARIEYLPYSGHGSGDRRLRVSMVVHPNHRDPAFIQVTKADGGTAILKVDGAKRVIVGTRTAGSHDVTERAFTLPQSLDVITVSAIFRDDVVDVESSFGQEAVIRMKTPLGPVDRMDLAADYQAAIAGVQVSDPGVAGGHVALDWKPEVVNRYGWHVWPQKIAPSIRDEVAADVLEEFSGAMMSPVYFDRNGVVQIAGSDTLHYQAAVVGVDVQSTIQEMTWSLSLLDYRNRVEVEWDDVLASINLMNRHKTITVSEGSKQTITDWDQIHETIEVPLDEEWISPDMDPTEGRLTVPPWDEDPSIRETFNSGENSWWGMTVTEEVANADGTKEQVERWYNLATPLPVFEVSRPNPWKLDWRLTVADPAALRVPERPELNRRYWGVGMPLIRASGKVKRYKKTEIFAEPGYTTPKVLPFKMGRWCTQAGLANHFGKFLHDQVSVPRAIVSGMVINFDPRVDAGTVIQIDSLQLHGVAIEGLVMSAKHDPARNTTTITLRVIKTKTDLNSYNDLALAWNGASYSTVQAAWATIAGTYEAVETDPLWKGYRR